jgi:hypothetical protein
LCTFFAAGGVSHIDTFDYKPDLAKHHGQALTGKGKYDPFFGHQLAFTCWLAGAGLKPGISYGASDEIGFNVGENAVTTYDFHATILHLLGLDHTKLTFYHNGIQRRLTDVHGNVVKDILGFAES